MAEGLPILNGYLDVKVPEKSKRGFIPWKAWKRHRITVRRLNGVEFGVELVVSGVQVIKIPRQATICRSQSRSKKYAFGIFSNNKKPLVFLCGSSEFDTQKWIACIRQSLPLSPPALKNQESFYVSLVDDAYSRAAGLTGMFGILRVCGKHLVISDPVTEETKVAFEWKHFHQFHLAVSGNIDDAGRIIVLHTSSEFWAGPGQIYFFCQNASDLVQYLVNKSKLSRLVSSTLHQGRRLSRSLGDLSNFEIMSFSDITTPEYIRSQCSSEDSGIRISLTSDDSDYSIRAKVVGMSFCPLSTTPGGSEIGEDNRENLSSSDDSLGIMESFDKRQMFKKRTSSSSIMSGVYEEIPDLPISTSSSNKFNHVYENPIDILLDPESDYVISPPPLPPRKHPLNRLESDEGIVLGFSAVESEYIVMSRSPEPPQETVESHYVRMDGVRSFS